MREVGAFEAKNRFGTLLDWVERGEEVLITRRGKIVARLVPGASGFDKVKAEQPRRASLHGAQASRSAESRSRIS
jgi:prevent-host-death family protein